MIPRLLSLKQAAAYTGLPRRDLRHLGETGQLPYTLLVGTARRKRWFSQRDLDALLGRNGR